jgi:hypothetical protein
VPGRLALADAQRHYDIHRRLAHLKPPLAHARSGLLTRSLTVRPPRGFR